MADKHNNPPQGAPLAGPEKAADSPHESESHNGEGVEPQQATGTGPPMEPQDETFWESSVDAKELNLPDTDTAQESPPVTATGGGTPEAGSLPEGEEVTEEDPSGEVEEDGGGRLGEHHGASGDEPAAPTEEMRVTAAEDTAGGASSEGDGEERELVAANQEEPDRASQQTGPAQDAWTAKEPEPVREETVPPAEEAAAVAPVKTGWYSSRKTALMASGMVLLILGSVGFSVVLNRGAGDTFIAPFPGKQLENAYEMQFFLPLDVGYEKARFVRVTIALELAERGYKKEIDNNLSPIRQEVIDLLLSKSPGELKSGKGKNLLREEITRSLNDYLARDCVKETYFTELVIL